MSERQIAANMSNEVLIRLRVESSVLRTERCEGRGQLRGVRNGLEEEIEKLLVVGDDCVVPTHSCLSTL